MRSLRHAVGLRDLAARTDAAAPRKHDKSTLAQFKQYRQADGLHYFKLVEPGGRVLLQSAGFASPREAGQRIAQLRQGDPLDSAPDAQAAPGVTEAEIVHALTRMRDSE